MIKTYIFFLVFISNVTAQITFNNVADSMGITHSVIGANYGGGVSFCDFNNDGLDDISLVNGTGFDFAIFKNNITNNNFINFNSQLSITDTSLTKTILWADFDNDGDQDLFIATFGSQNKLYRNDGNNILTDITNQSGIPLENSPSTAAAWADFNNDGYIDLYVGNYDLAGNVYHNYLLQNNKNRTFTDVAFDSGAIDTIGGSNISKLPLAIFSFDYNNDGLTDIYIANDRKQGNTLLKNTVGMNFIDVSESSNTDLKFDAMGLTVGDYNNDGFFDIYVSNSTKGNGLLRNNGDGTFTDVATSLGVLAQKVSWGNNFFDYDNDGDIDIFVSVSGGGIGMPNTDRHNVLYENIGDSAFQEVTNSNLNIDTSRSYGNAIGDFNNDGFIDIVVINSTPSFTKLWKNSGNSNNWVKIKLVGVQDNKDGIGAIIKLYYGNRRIMRLVNSGGSYESQNSYLKTIGVGTSNIIDSIKVYWPNGSVDTRKNISVKQLLVITQGEIVTGINDKKTLPLSFKLEQNYPNPFNPSTTISFSILSTSNVRLIVYDLLGREIKNLINSKMNAGNHQINFDASNLDSGVYFYKIIVNSINGNNYNLTKKMILLK